MDRWETQRRWAGMVASTVVVLSLAAGCSSGGSAERVDTGRGMQGPAATDGTEGASPSTTNAPSPTSTAAPSAKPASAEGCDELALLVLDSAVRPDDEADVPSEAEERAAAQRLATLVPEELRADFGALVAAVLNGDPEPPEGVDVAILLTDVIAWGAPRCPQPEPVWACPFRSTWTPVGEAIGIDDQSTGATAFASPEEAAGQGDARDGERMVLARDATLVTFGWLDDAGLVTRRLEVEREGEGWQRGKDQACRDGGAGAPDEGFETVGEAVGSAGPSRQRI